MKKNRLIVLLPLVFASLAGCNSNNGGDQGGGGGATKDIAYDDTREDYYDNVESRNKFNKDNELNFDDEITNGLSDSVWNTLDGYWENGGTTPHNGVRRRNLFYTKDSDGNGYLALKARGLYNQEDPSQAGKPEGACIETKNSLGPGRYEVYMAAMPREGGVTAMWTYKCESTEDQSQNEIDIEIGGSAQYTNLWCTSWTTKTNKATKDPDVSDILYMNDGKIHKYTFDWYTDYGEKHTGRVDWFIDGHFVHKIEGGTVTDIDMPIWLGIWMPSWAGNATWIEDYVIVDRVTYTAFDEDQYFTHKRAYNTYSPMAPSQSGIQTVDFASITSGLNKLSNASFENITPYASNDYYGWSQFQSTLYTGTHEFVNDASDGSKAFKVKANTTSDPEANEAYYYQRVTCSYEGFKYKLEIDAKLDSADSEAEIILWQRRRSNSGTVTKAVIPVTSTTYQQISSEITMLENAGALDVFLHVKKGSATFDNAKLFKI